MSKIEVVKFGLTKEQREFRQALAAKILPVIMGTIESVGEVTKEMRADAARMTARLTLLFVDALIEELEED